MKQGWEIKKLGEVCEIVSGSTPKTSEPSYWDGEHYWVTPAELDGAKYISSTSRTITDKGVKSAHLQLLPSGTVLLSSRAPIGKVAITTAPMYCNQGFKNLVCSVELHNGFAYWFLYHNTEYLNSLGTGATFKEISKRVVEQITIPVPPREEQERIVAELDCLSGVIEKKREQLRELDALAQSIFYQMFGDPITNEKGWETKLLKNSVVEMFLGPFGSALKTDCYVSKEDAYCMVYEQKHAIKKTMELETHYIDKDKFESLKRFEVHSGDFIMSCRGTIGEIYRLPNDAPIGIIHPSLMKIRIREDIYHPIFFIRLLTHIVKNENTNGNCVQMAITAKELGARTPITPPLASQQEFANRIEKIEQQKELIKKSIAEVEDLFNSRMSYYFN